jgi:chromosome segregation ATPase
MYNQLLNDFESLKRLVVKLETGKSLSCQRYQVQESQIKNLREQKEQDAEQISNLTKALQDERNANKLLQGNLEKEKEINVDLNSQLTQSSTNKMDFSINEQGQVPAVLSQDPSLETSSHESFKDVEYNGQVHGFEAERATLKDEIKSLQQQVATLESQLNRSKDSQLENEMEWDELVGKPNAQQPTIGQDLDDAESITLCTEHSSFESPQPMINNSKVPAASEIQEICSLQQHQNLLSQTTSLKHQVEDLSKKNVYLRSQVEILTNQVLSQDEEICSNTKALLDSQRKCANLIQVLHSKGISAKESLDLSDEQMEVVPEHRNDSESAANQVDLAAFESMKSELHSYQQNIAQMKEKVIDSQAGKEQALKELQLLNAQFSNQNKTISTLREKVSHQGTALATFHKKMEERIKQAGDLKSKVKDLTEELAALKEQNNIRAREGILLKELQGSYTKMKENLQQTVVDRNSSNAKLGSAVEMLQKLESVLTKETELNADLQSRLNDKDLEINTIGKELNILKDRIGLVGPLDALIALKSQLDTQLSKELNLNAVL